MKPPKVTRLNIVSSKLRSNKPWEQDYGSEWRELSNSCKKRDGFKCTRCYKSNADGVKLHAHHVIPLSRGGRNRLSNLKTYCESCHRRFHLNNKTFSRS